MRFHVQVGNGSARISLLKWLRSKCPEVKDFSADWRSGDALCALVNALRPGSIGDVTQKDAREKVDLAMRVAEQHLGVPAILAPEHLTVESPDELCVMAYLAYFRCADSQAASASKDALAMRAFAKWVRHRQQATGVAPAEKLEELWPASNMESFLGRVLGIADLQHVDGDEEASARRVVACLAQHGVRCREEVLLASLNRSPSAIGEVELECLWAVIRLTFVTELGLEAREEEALLQALRNRYGGVSMHALTFSNMLPIMSDVVERLSDWKRNGDSEEEVASVVGGALALLMPFPLLERRDLTEQCGGDSRVLMLALALLLDALGGSKRIAIARSHHDQPPASLEQLLELCKSQTSKIHSLERELREREQAVEQVAREVAARLQSDDAEREKLVATEQRIARLTEQLQYMERETAQAEAEHRKLLDENRTKAESIKHYKDSLAQTRAKLKAALVHHEHCERERRVQRRLFEDLTMELDRREHSVASEARKLEEKLAALVDEAKAAQKQVEQERDFALLELVASRHAQSMLEQELTAGRAAARELETELSITRETQRVHDEEMDRSMEMEAETTLALKQRLCEEMEHVRDAYKERDEARAIVSTWHEQAELMARIKAIEEAAAGREQELRVRLRDCELAAEARVQEMEVEMKSREKKMRRADRKRVVELEEQLQAEVAQRAKAVAEATEGAERARAAAANEAQVQVRHLDVEKKAQSVRVRRCAWAMWWVVLALCCLGIFVAPAVQV